MTSRPRKTILLADADPRSLRILDVSLRGAGFDVQPATTGPGAWEILEGVVPDLVIADVGLPDLDGFEVCTRAHRHPILARVPFLLLVPDEDPALKIRGLEAGAVDCLARTAYLREILERVRGALQRRDRQAIRLRGTDARPTRADDPQTAKSTADRAPEPFAGQLADITVVDLVGLIEANGGSGVVHLRGPRGVPGSIYFRNGTILDAEVGRLSGTDAVARLFSWASGQFEIEWKTVRRKNIIDRASSDLVIEGMRRLDAWNQLTHQMPDPDAVLEVDYERLADRLAEIPDEVNAILRLCDGVRSVAQVVQDGTLPDVEALTALLRLGEEGIVAPRSSAAATALPPPSSRIDDWADSPWASAPLSLSAPARNLPLGSGPVEQALADRLADNHPDNDVSDAAVLAEELVTTSADSGAYTEVEMIVDSGPSASLAAAVSTLPPAPPTRGNIIQFPAALDAGTPPGRSTLRGLVNASSTILGFGEPPRPLPPSPPEPADEMISPSRVASGSSDDAIPELLGSGHSPAPAESSQTDLAPRSLASLAVATDTRPAHEPAPPRSATSPAPGTNTYRGLGPRPSVVVSPAISADAEAPAERSQIAGELVASPPAAARTPPPPPSRTTRPSATVDAAPSSPAAPSDDPPLDGDGAPRATPAGETDSTVRLQFVDDDISRRDALDELGLPSRWRALGVLAAAVLLVLAGAVGARRFRGQGDHPAPPASAERAVRAPDEVVHNPAPMPTIPSPLAPSGTLPAATSPAGTTPANPPDVDLPGAGTGAPGAAAPVAALPAPGPEVSAATSAAPGSPGPRSLVDCREAFARGRMRAALASCRTAVAASPRSAEALALLAQTELNRGQSRRAGELATKAIAIDPELADAYVILGGVSQDRGQNQKAKAAYRRYLQLAPTGRFAAELRAIINSL